MKSTWRVVLLLSLTYLAVRPAGAQDNIKISGLAYVDYAYVLASPLSEADGENGFGYRRLYLTTDYRISDTFSGRARLEASDASTTSEGRPAPFVKDLYLKWSDVWGEGHDLVVGISPPPSFEVSEKFWGYRSLEKTIMDRDGIVSSRDFGVAARGRLTSDGSLRYGLMVANDNNVKAETDKYKRFYGQLEFYPGDALTFTLGGDYAGSREANGVNLNAFAGVKSGPFRLGAEGFYNRFDLRDSNDNIDLMGVSVFAALRLAEAWEVVGRFDQFERDLGFENSSESFLLAGLAFQPHPNVRFIPNVLASKESVDDDALVTGRITLHMDF